MVRNICCIIFHLPHAAAPVTATDLPKVTKTNWFYKKRASKQFQIYCKSFCTHQSSSIHRVFNAFSCTYNRIAQEDKSKLTSQIFCNSFSIYHSCAKMFGSTVLCRGQDALKVNSHLIIYTDLNTLQGVWETLRPVYYLKKMDSTEYQVDMFLILWELIIN